LLAGKKSMGPEGAWERHPASTPARIKVRSGERQNNLTQRRQGAKTCKEELRLSLCALQGHKIVAAGNAPGTHDVRPSDPEGVALPRAAERTTGMTPCGFDPFRVGPCWGRVFRGRCPRLLDRSPAGIKAKVLTSARLLSDDSTESGWSSSGSRRCW
jgi:hypothetical protein